MNGPLLRMLDLQRELVEWEIAAYRRRMRNPLYRLKEFVRRWWEL